MLKSVKAAWKPLSSSHRGVSLDAAGSRTATEVVQQQLHPTPTILDIGLDVAVRAAQQQTGAAAAALALTQEELLICRARVGSIAPSLGTPLNKSLGITGACVRTGKALYCSDAETDARVDRGLCRELNIRSILVVPILEGQMVIGVVEVLSPQADAFETTHVRWLMQLAHFVQAFAGKRNSPSPQPATLLQKELIPEKIDKNAQVEQPKNVGEPLPPQEDSEKTDLAAIRAVLNRVGTASWDEISQELGSRFEDSREPSKKAHDNIPRIDNQNSRWTALFWSR
jgi:putative methionine-R-sulfoxide reductase with GAF domain